ncbi:hypothetical protein [Micromonospora sp. NPDC005206]|uniref:hypothetical protein n=1 Tax=Micromonospora sp. NPDC005206 TaxID=3157022 RepID=UPI00339E26CE
MTKPRDLAIDMPSDREITLTRSFDAPRELVYAAHTQAEHLKHWWGAGQPAGRRDRLPGGRQLPLRRTRHGRQRLRLPR